MVIDPLLNDRMEETYICCDEALQVLTDMDGRKLGKSPGTLKISKSAGLRRLFRGRGCCPKEHQVAVPDVFARTGSAAITAP